ncbi:hypothetical protein ASPCAL02867 [Aspergillus calidoustus]|uniref:Uncharacterized protein n=1 Tax=Aspergillus calidoustus TaxID=454130 RepID=A0A0U5GP34_ASPCI|nr:hypothetical protein ASPCAL02867 [Aspergillus calidoustus]
MTSQRLDISPTATPPTQARAGLYPTIPSSNHRASTQYGCPTSPIHPFSAPAEAGIQQPARLLLTSTFHQPCSWSASLVSLYIACDRSYRASRNSATRALISWSVGIWWDFALVSWTSRSSSVDSTALSSIVAFAPWPSVTVIRSIPYQHNPPRSPRLKNPLFRRNHRRNLLILPKMPHIDALRDPHAPILSHTHVLCVLRRKARDILIRIHTIHWTDHKPIDTLSVMEAQDHLLMRFSPAGLALCFVNSLCDLASSWFRTLAAVERDFLLDMYGGHG